MFYKYYKTHKKMTEIPVLYNNCHGGWSPSQQAIELYNRRMTQLNPTYKPITDLDLENVNRHDPILVQIYHELGKDFDGHYYSQTQIEYIDEKYADYYHLQDFDGYETVVVELVKYELHTLKGQLKALLNNTMTDGEKIAELKKIMEIGAAPLIDNASIQEQ